jgi:hypothetical protein
VPKSEGPSPGDSLPKLSLSQRLLAALPNMQRPSPGTAQAGRRSGHTASNGSSEVVRPDDVVAPRRTSPAAAGQRGAARPKSPPARPGAKPDPYADTSIEELRHAMKYLDDRERRVALFVGPLLAALDVALTVVALHSNPAAGHKNHVAPSNIVALGVGSAVVALLVVVAAFYRRRSFTIFALLFAGYGGGFVTMIPSWLVAGWLFIHFNRMQRSVVARTGGPGARQGAARTRADRTSNNKPARPRLGRKEKAPEPTAPPASKRYTPPKPAGG